MTWRVFDALVRRYCKTDHNDPKPVTFREICNDRLMQIMAVIDGLDDPRYKRSHVLLNAGTALQLEDVTSMVASTKTIVQSTQAWVPGVILTAIYQSGPPTVFNYFVARVLTAVGTTYTVEVLIGAMVDKASCNFLRISSNLAFTGNWDTALLRLRSIAGMQDFPVTAGVSAKRPWYGHERYEVFREIHKDYALDNEVSYYNRGGVVEIGSGESAAAVMVPQVEFDCTPALYTEVTGGNTIELLPEHLRMLFDGVATQVLTMTKKQQDAGLKARMRDDLVRFYNAKREEVERKMINERTLNE